MDFNGAFQSFQDHSNREYSIKDILEASKNGSPPDRVVKAKVQLLATMKELGASNAIISEANEGIDEIISFLLDWYNPADSD